MSLDHICGSICFLLHRRENTSVSGSGEKLLTWKVITAGQKYLIGHNLTRAHGCTVTFQRLKRSLIFPFVVGTGEIGNWKSVTQVKLLCVAVDNL